MDAETPPPTAPSSALELFVPYIPTYTHLILAALFPIYAGAHASLRRPLNTLTPAQARALLPSSSPSESDDEEDEEDTASASAVENLTATDALMFPVTAGALLSGLYLIIKYLDDPSLLSRIMTYYFSFIGILSVGKAFSDLSAVLTHHIFPPTYTDASGNIFTAGPTSWLPVNPTTATTLTSPIPFAVSAPASFTPYLWRLRRRLQTRYRLHIRTHSVTALKKTLWLGDFLAVPIGSSIIALYTLLSKPWLLTNTMGISFSYGAMQLLSPTTFPIATLLLSLLFAYDIFFVFYTPLMVTVATSLDVPIKLVFPRPGNGLAMLGLGDIVIPGLVIAMALRFDQWRHYEAQRRALESVRGADDTTTLKPRYHKAASFPKQYFWSSVGGYAVGILVTLGVMHGFGRAQPALLYLVPSVLGAVWGCAVVRGEVKLVWGYTEEGDEVKKPAEEEEKAEVVEKVEVGDVQMLEIELVKKGPAGARRKAEAEKNEKVSLQKEQEQELSSASSSSSEDEPETRKRMWGTTIIGSDG